MTRSSVGVCCCVVAMLLAVGGCGSFDAERSMLQGRIDKAQTQLALAREDLKEARDDLADSKEQLGELDADWRNVVRDLAAANAKEQALGFKLRKAVQRAAAAETKLTEQQQEDLATWILEELTPVPILVKLSPIVSA